jgi:hypothetical protein
MVFALRAFVLCCGDRHLAERPMTREWPKDWSPLRDQHVYLEWGRMHNELASEEEIAASLELELAREACTSQPLHAKSTTAIGCLRNCPNDFLFSIDDGSGAFAWVHLTWQREESPVFPRCRIYRDWIDFFSNAPVTG